jgi:type IV secretory pathway VirJ component
MKLLVTAIFLAIFFCAEGVTATAEEFLRFGRFGNVFIYRQSPNPSHVVLFVSGDGGWNLGVVDMAKTLSYHDALVIGVDITRYLRELANSKEPCLYPAGDFEMLSKFVQKSLQFPRYVTPVLVGYSSGATLVYAALAQAPPNTFRGAISLGFCPDLDLSKPLCRGYGLEWRPGPKGKGFIFLPAKNLDTPWIALQGTIDQVCDPAATDAFVKQVKGGKIVVLPKVGHGFAVQRNWMPQFKEVFMDLVQKREETGSQKVEELKDLPVVELRSKNPRADLFAVIVSGDGGWAAIDRDLGQRLAEKGISVVGLNSLQYFWKRRSPDETGKDLERILTHYFSLWGQGKVILIGYSLGADVLPFMVNRLTPELTERVSLVALLGPSDHVTFEFHIKDWLGESSASDSLPVLPEVSRLGVRKILCFCGEKETDSPCSKLDPQRAKTFVLPGAHHFGGKYSFIAETILHEMSGSSQP